MSHYGAPGTRELCQCFTSGPRLSHFEIFSIRPQVSELEFSPTFDFRILVSIVVDAGNVRHPLFDFLSRFEIFHEPCAIGFVVAFGEY